MSLHTFTSGGETFAVHPLTMRFAKVGKGQDISLGPQDTFTRYQGRSFCSVAPNTIVLMLTYSCNMACRYCCQGEIPDVKAVEMPLRTAQMAIDWLAGASGGFPVMSVGFFGGEPFMKPMLMKQLADYAADIARQAGKRLVLGSMTNGLLLTDEVIDFIDRTDMDLTVSFDGPPHVQNANRVLKGGGPSYDVIVPAIRRLTQRRPGVVVRPTVFADEDLDAVLSACRELGFKSCRLVKVSSSLLPGGLRNDEESSTDSFLSHFERQADRILRAVAIRDKTAVKAVAFDSVFFEAVKLAARANHPMLPTPRRWFACGAGVSFLTVDVKGDIYPCPRFLAIPQARLGNVLTGEFASGDHGKTPLLHRQDCRDCWARFFCGGGCSVEHMGASGSLFQVNPNTCRLRKAKYEQGIRVAASLDEIGCQFLEESLRE